MVETVRGRPAGAADPLAEPLKDLVGGRTAKVLERNLELRTVGELLRHYPRRYAKRGELSDLASLTLDDYVTVLAEVEKVAKRPFKGRRGSLTEVTVTDGTSSLALTFFNQPWLERDLRPGRVGLFSGRVTEFRRHRQLAQPEFELLKDDQDAEAEAERYANELIPFYPATAGFSTRKIQACVRLALDSLKSVPDPLPQQVRDRHRLLGLREAFEKVHRPEERSDYQLAKNRLKWDEALPLQVVLAQRRRAALALPAVPRPVRTGGLLDRFDERLPFQLTAGQREVCRQIEQDLAATHPMHRLLQGEVGSGKTVVALRAMLTVVDAGGQAVLLAPTEVLAQQHHRSILDLLGPLARAGQLDGDPDGTRVALLTGSQGAKERRANLLDAASGAAGIVVGTHAVIEDTVQFADLGLVVVDEQHRFGVEQRDALRAKAEKPPHLLVMTATPIPRTVAMTVFGDLETSVLAELPRGRSPISTFVVPAADKPHYLARAWDRIREEVAAGHQAYVVCPRIGDGAETGSDEAGGYEAQTDEQPKARRRRNQHEPDPDDRGDGESASDGHGHGDDDADAESALEGQAQLSFDDLASPASAARAPLSVVDMARQLNEQQLAGLRIGVLHGRLPPEEKDSVMTAFAAGEVDVLVATTVIEVGVNVPNATVMAVLDADRFGVSQLHQLRGRVGRGTAPGLCLLVTEAPADSPARERLDAVAGTLDGFELSRIDLEQRREGDVLGASQSGRRSSLKLLRVLHDEDILRDAREAATELVDRDPELTGEPALAAAVAALVTSDRATFLEKS
ncbi:ATP-dependent DNA helicase RecG [Actinocrinis sp.]|uniref:ATP-dependent DNA helicase RecG n=1 Tax=Actinocrinis sp. TaxID=1920516 RepID=UPI002D247C7F|nr:ATP-dependent DNA helicase RecG [Actinocrinis sp.]HZP52038.1 ATP-dependent DNA helicase RecG [Actinocrinis sp.]